MTDMEIIEIDFDDDGSPEILVKDNNGKTVYVNMKWVFLGIATGVTTFMSYVAWFS